MNKWYQKFISPQPDYTRDKFLKKVCNEIIKKQENPKILTIGAERDLDTNSIEGDGWADFYFAEILKELGHGELHIVDINGQAIANCKTMLQDFLDWGVNICFYIDDGINVIDDSFSLIYLDGGDEILPCLQQFEKINRNKSVIVCDDFHKKFTLVKAKYQDFELHQINNIHQCAIFYPSQKISSQNISLKQSISSSGKTNGFNENIINDVFKTNRIVVVEKENQKIGIFVPHGDNRDPEITLWHKKVMSHFHFPTNYLLFPFSQNLSHGSALNWIVQKFLNTIDIFIFLDDDAIPTRVDFLQIYYDKLKDKETIISGVGQNNHLSKPNGDKSHPYAYGSGLGISKDLYIKLGMPSFDADNIHSDTAEQITYACEKLGYNVCLMWPQKVEGLTNQDCDDMEMDRKHKLSDVGNFKFGFGTEYSCLYHQMAAGCKRHKENFIKKCQEIIKK